MADEKTHYRKAFDSPYLSSADIVDETALTIRQVALEIDRTNKTKDYFNTAYFVEKEIRPGEKLKPMILNVVNSKVLKEITGSPFIDDWVDVPISVFVDPNVKFGREVVEGLRIRSREKTILTPQNKKSWENAKAAYKRDGNLKKVLSKVSISEEHQLQLIAECDGENPNVN
jgi:hypothetical protein